MSAHDPEDVARLREAFASRQDEGTGDSIAPERIFDALHANVTPEERQAVVEQLVTDPAAAEAWRLARDLRPDMATGRRKRRLRGRRAPPPPDR